MRFLISEVPQHVFIDWGRRGRERLRRRHLKHPTHTIHVVYWQKNRFRQSSDAVGAGVGTSSVLVPRGSFMFVFETTQATRARFVGIYMKHDGRTIVCATIPRFLRVTLLCYRGT